MSNTSIPTTWPTEHTLDLFYIKGRLGWKGLRASEFQEEGPFLITGTDFVGGKVDWSRSFHISNERFIESPEITVQPEDILITKDGTIGKVAFIERIPFPGKASLNSHLFLVRSRSKKIYQRFAFYIFQSYLFRRFIDTKQTGSTLSGLPQRLFEQFGVPLPPVDQQRRIAEILSTVDKAIEQTEALIAKYQQIKAGLMHDLFTRGLTPDGHLRPTRAQAPQLYKDSPLGWIPKEWDIQRLDSVAEVSRGKFTIRPRNDPRFYGGQYPFIQTGDVALSGGRTLSSYSQTLNEKGLSVSRLFPPGTIMVTIAANIADTCIIGIPMCAPDSLVGVQPKEQENARFIELSIRRRKTWLAARAPQTAQRNINLEDLRPLLILWPRERERSRISEIYETQDTAIEGCEAQRQKLQKQKHGLMHDLLTGRVRVKVAETASI